MSQPACVDLLFLARNRLEFTRESFDALLSNTDWQLVNRFLVYDDGSTDGTAEWLSANIARVPAASSMVRTRFASPVAAMVDFVRNAAAPILAKTDNDTMLPPHWLEASVAVMDRHPELSLLGLEAMYAVDDDPQCVRSYTPSPFVSGIGLYRRSAFDNSLPQPRDRWFGFEDWQAGPARDLVRGWITPSLPLFFLDRCPFEPWSCLTRRYDRQGFHRSWPKYDPAHTLWQWRWQQPSSATPSSSGDSRFLCAMRIKNEAAHIEEVLSRALTLCARALVLDDHSTDATREICRSFGPRVQLIPSPFAGLDEVRDKNFLLARILDLNPDWVLWVDGDEVLERSGAQKIGALIDRSPRAATFSLRIAYVWNQPDQVRVDGIFGTFRRPSLFRVRGQTKSRLHFVPSGCGGNFHCGNVPRGLVGAACDSEVRLKHYGYMTNQQRIAKYEFYSTRDPGNESEDHYRHLAGISGARHAPGPLQCSPWIE